MENYIKYWRKRRGISQATLASTIGVHVNTVVRWETNQRRPRIAEIRKLCQALEVSEQELLFGPDGGRKETEAKNDVCHIQMFFDWDSEASDVAAQVRREFLAQRSAKIAYQNALIMEAEADADMGVTD